MKSFNDPFLPLIDHRLSDMLEAPIFKWADPENSKILQGPDNHGVLSRLAHERVLPFPMVRLSVKPNSEDFRNGLKSLSFILWQKGDTLLVLAATNGSLLCAYTIDHACLLSLEFVMLGRRVFRGSEQAQLSAEERRGIEGDVSSFNTSICWFIRESMFSGNFLAQVKPIPKSGTPSQVKWSESQIHHVIVHRHDGMNRAAGPGGGKSGAARMAHTRRAHMRILRSQRWGIRAGRRVFVKSCWVGPPEWKINDSIYKILPPDLRGPA